MAESHTRDVSFAPSSCNEGSAARSSTITAVPSVVRHTDSDYNSATGRCSCPERHRRNLVVCIDGTANRFGDKNTNVIEIYNLLKHGEEEQQLTYYNSGIGTFAPNRRTIKRVRQWVDSTIDFAIAWNFEVIVLDAYRWLSETYQSGDRIFLFGFSRGAYQVRVLSGMIEKVGLIYKGNDKQIPFAYQLYVDPKTADIQIPKTGVSPSSSGNNYVSKAARFKETFSREDVKVHFVGAWDTVSSIGAVWRKNLLPLSGEGMQHVCYFRHALALHERRVRFEPEFAYGAQVPPPPPSRPAHTKEVWFAGAHGDVGGGYTQNLLLDQSRPALRWMYWEARKAGVKLRPFERDIDLHKELVITKTLKGAWYLLEFLPLGRLYYEAVTAKAQPTTEARQVQGSSLERRWEVLHQFRQIPPSETVAAGISGFKKPRSRRPDLTHADSSVDVLYKESMTKRLHLCAGRTILPGQKIHVSVRDSLQDKPSTSSKRAFIWRQKHSRFPAACMVGRKLEDFWNEGRGLSDKHDSHRDTDSLHEGADHSIKPNTTSTWERSHCDPYYALQDILHDHLSDRVAQAHADNKYLDPKKDRVALKKHLSSYFASNFEDAEWALWQILRNLPELIVPATLDTILSVYKTVKPLRKRPCADIWPSLSLALKEKSWTGENNTDKNRMLVSDFLTKFTTTTFVDLNTSGVPITCATFSPDSRWLATAHGERDVHIWDPVTGGLMSTLKALPWCKAFCVAWSPDSQLVVVGENKRIVLWDVSGILTGSPKVVAKMTKMGVHLPLAGVVVTAAFSPDGQTIAFSCGDESSSGVYLWRIRPPAPFPQLIDSFHNGSTDPCTVDHLRFSSHGREDLVCLAATLRDARTRVWQLPPSDDVNAKARSVVLSPQQRELLEKRFDGPWDLDFQATSSSEFLHHLYFGKGAQYVASSEHGRRVLALTNDMHVQVWDCRLRDHPVHTFELPSLQKKDPSLPVFSLSLRHLLIIERGSRVRIYFLSW